MTSSSKRETGLMSTIKTLPPIDIEYSLLGPLREETKGATFTQAFDETGVLTLKPSLSRETWFSVSGPLIQDMRKLGRRGGLVSFLVEPQSADVMLLLAFGDARSQLRRMRSGQRLQLPPQWTIADLRCGVQVRGPGLITRLAMRIEPVDRAATKSKEIAVGPTQPPTPEAAAITPASEPAPTAAARPDCTRLAFVVSQLSSVLSTVDGVALGPSGVLSVGLEQHVYVWFRDNAGIAALARENASCVLRLQLTGKVEGLPSVELFVGFMVGGEWVSASASVGYPGSIRAPADFTAARLGLRLNGEGSLSEIGIEVSAEPELVVKSRIELRSLAQHLSDARPKIALIADEFTTQSFRGVADVISIRPNDWRSLLRLDHPDILFVESAWAGNGGAWAQRIVRNLEELRDLVEWCRVAAIPTIFWNKEDPVHFERFLPAALLFDRVYTTSVEKIEEYKKSGCPHADVLPFAVDLTTYNPIGSGAPREPCAVFAGSYYAARYPERAVDMGRMFDIAAPYGLKIFDRHAGSTGAQYAFPESFRSFVVGSATSHQLDDEFKRARVALNVNTVKTSSSMLARRVVEIAVTGTPIVSNASPALKALFGDAVFGSDESAALADEMERLFHDDDYWRARRLALMRAALMRHTMQDRLSTIYRDLGVSIRDPRASVCLVVPPRGTLHSWGTAFPMRVELSQEQLHTPLYRFIADRRDIEWVHVAGDDADVDEQTIDELLRHAAYARSDAIGLIDSGTPFKFGEPLRAGATLIGREALQFSRLAVEDFEPERFRRRLGDAGLKTFAVESLRAAPPLTRPVAVETPPAPWRALEGKAQFAGSAQEFSLSAIESDSGTLAMEGPAVERGSDRRAEGVAVAFDFDDAAGELAPELRIKFFRGETALATRVAPPGRTSFVRAPESWTRMVPEIVYLGRTDLRCRIGFDAAITTADDFVKQRLAGVADLSEWLCVTSAYPSPDNLYRNAFVHTRMRAYVAAGRKTAVVALDGGSHVLSSYEYEGVLVFSGRDAALTDVLQARTWSRALCHIVSQGMLDTLDAYAPGIAKIVWVHAIEAERWYRRWFNIDLTAPDLTGRLRAEIDESDMRNDAVRNVYERSGQGAGDCRVVFVSEWFRRNVATVDVRPPPKDYRVIPNPIDTGLFASVNKDAADRFHWLSIRPFASRKYGNDITVAAILALKDKPWFPQVRVTIVGRGPLFAETVAPLREFANVTLEESFLPQAIIPEYHRRHGIFLCPTRHDSQGVSLGEAMASGLVPVSNDCMAISEFVPQDWGTLAPPDDADEIAMILEKLIEDSERFQRLSRSASAHIVGKCGAEAVVQREIEAISYYKKPDGQET